MCHKTCTAVCAIVLGSAACAAPAHGDTLTATQILRVEFVMPDTPFPFGTPDTLIFGVDVTRLEPFGSLSVSVFDGRHLLGTYSTSVNGETSEGGLRLEGWFLSPTSTYRVPVPFAPPALIDFASIAERTIEGRLELAIASGAVDIRPETVGFILGRSTPSGSAHGTPFTNPVVTSTVVTAPVPEPATLCLVLSGAVAVLPRRRQTGNC